MRWERGHFAADWDPLALGRTGSITPTWWQHDRVDDTFRAQRLINLFYWQPKMHQPLRCASSESRYWFYILWVWPSFCSQLHREILGIIPLEPGRLLWIGAKGSKLQLVIFDGENTYIALNYTATLPFTARIALDLAHFGKAQDSHQGSQEPPFHVIAFPITSFPNEELQGLIAVIWMNSN